MTTMVSLHRLLTSQFHSLYFLLYVEWVVITVCFFLPFVEFVQLNQLSTQLILLLAMLSVMVTLVPTGKLLHKVSYVAIESTLIFYGTTLGNFPSLSVLYVIVIIQSCFLFNSLGRWAVAGLSLLLFLMQQVHDTQSIYRLLNPYQQRFFLTHSVTEIVMFGLVLSFAVKLTSILLAQSKIEKQLAVAHQQLQHHALLVKTLTELKNRNFVAHTVHDALGHTLMAQNIQLQTAVKLWQHDPDKAKPFLEQAQQLAVEAIQEIRRSIRVFQTDDREKQAMEMISPLANVSQDLDVTPT